MHKSKNQFPQDPQQRRVMVQWASLSRQIYYMSISTKDITSIMYGSFRIWWSSYVLFGTPYLEEDWILLFLLPLHFTLEEHFLFLSPRFFSSPSLLNDAPLLAAALLLFGVCGSKSFMIMSEIEVISLYSPWCGHETMHLFIPNLSVTHSTIQEVVNQRCTSYTVRCLHF